jgi:protein associated with RNAse G/E
MFKVSSYLSNGLHHRLWEGPTVTYTCHAAITHHFKPDGGKITYTDKKEIINWVVRALNADWLKAMVYHGYDIRKKVSCW